MKERVEEKYIFTGFGFDVLLQNVIIKSAHGSEYPDINLNEVKLLTAKQLLKSKERLTGKKLKFLRTFLKLSYQKLSELIEVPASTLKSWEDKIHEPAGLTVPQERHFRIHAIEAILDSEKRFLEKDVLRAEKFETPDSLKPLDISDSQDFSYLEA